MPAPCDEGALRQAARQQNHTNGGDNGQPVFPFSDGVGQNPDSSELLTTAYEKRYPIRCAVIWGRVARARGFPRRKGDPSNPQGGKLISGSGAVRPPWKSEEGATERARPIGGVIVSGPSIKRFKGAIGREAWQIRVADSPGNMVGRRMGGGDLDLNPGLRSEVLGHGHRICRRTP